MRVARFPFLSIASRGLYISATCYAMRREGKPWQCVMKERNEIEWVWGHRTFGHISLNVPRLDDVGADIKPSNLQGKRSS